MIMTTIPIIECSSILIHEFQLQKKMIILIYFDELHQLELLTLTFCHDIYQHFHAISDFYVSMNESSLSTSEHR